MATSNYRRKWPVNRALEGDPAKEKSRFTTGTKTDAADYFARVKRYNADLYRPSDTAPKATEVPYFAPASRTAGMNLGGGYETGDVNAIASRYGGVPYSAFAGGGTTGIVPGFTPSAPPTRKPPGAAGDTGSAGMEALPGTTYDQPPMPTAPAAESNGVTPPEGNALQRWMGKGGTDHTYNKANVERGIRPQIDARARPDPKASTAADEIRSKWAEKRPKAGWGDDPMQRLY